LLIEANSLTKHTFNKPVTEGESWKHNSINPLNKLKVAELRIELSQS